MKQIIVDIMILSDDYMKEYNLLNRYRVKAYVYNTCKVIEYGVDDDNIQDYQIGKIIRNSLV